MKIYLTANNPRLTLLEGKGSRLLLQKINPTLILQTKGLHTHTVGDGMTEQQVNEQIENHDIGDLAALFHSA